MSTKIVTRFAPSPTGELHIGGLRTALYSFALAKHSEGDFILRIEDTDKKREVAGSKEKIKQLLEKFGLKWDGYFEQSKRAEEGIYKRAAEKLVVDGKAFYCDCKPKNAKEEGYSKELRDPCRDAKKTSGAIKLKVPDNEKVSFKDFVLQKEVAWDTNIVADTTLLKSDGFPTYHLAVVIDDHDMGITHVLRGHDWMPSTPIHLLVYKYLGLSLPEIGHLTDILDPEGGKLSKRKGSTSCEGLLSEGYLPDAILNLVMLLGWAPKDNRELFTLEEFVKAFDPNGFQKSNPIFNRDKLDWFNGHYIREKPLKDLVGEVRNVSKHKLTDLQAERILGLVKDRMRTLADFDQLSDFFFEAPKPAPEAWDDSNTSLDHLEDAVRVLAKLECSKEAFEKGLQNLVGEKGWKMGDFFMSLRIAICGSRATPPITETMVVLGKEESIQRVKAAIRLLSES